MAQQMKYSSTAQSTGSGRSWIYLMLILFSFCSGMAQTPAIPDSSYQQKMQWFADAKLGIFIHWGIYAVDGIAESWSFFNGEISHEDYLKQTSGFTASAYEPADWAQLIKESGARYTVITSRHHDGFSLWDTRFGDLNAMKQAAAGRDVLASFVDAIRKEGLKLGLYYSLPDWSNIDYTHHTRQHMRYTIGEDPLRWERYRQYYMGQLEELRNAFDPDLWWFDGDWEHSAEEWKVQAIKSLLTQTRKDVIFNSRLNDQGDYKTPEIGLPVTRPMDPYWELCQTMNDSWGFQFSDKNYKSSQQIIDILVDCISKGGNLLLDIGPRADGTIPGEQVRILEDLGRFTSKHAEAIYGTARGIPYDHFYGPTTLSKDSTVLYVFVRDIPKDGKVILKGISSPIKKIHIVGNGALLSHKVISKVSWNTYPGVVYIDLPGEVIDPNYTVLAVQLDGTLRLYREGE